MVKCWACLPTAIGRVVNRLFVTLAACAVLVCNPSVGIADDSEARQIAKAIHRVYPSLVRVRAVVQSVESGRIVFREFSGSGTIISARGDVITNYHVVRLPHVVSCTLSTGESLAAVLIAADPLSDLAILRIEAAEGRAFPAAKFGDSDGLVRGQPVLAMGSPFGVSPSVTRGIVSNPAMLMPPLADAAAASFSEEDIGSLVRWIGHDAAIYPGNSGGPLVNLRGQIVGINEISYGLGGAIPGNLAKTIAAELVRFGGVTRSWIGLTLQPMIGAGRGALVSAVARGSPAEKSGLVPGDVLLRADQREINVSLPEDLPLANQTLFKLPVGAETSLQILRRSSLMRVSVTALARGSLSMVPIEVPEWGLVVSVPSHPPSEHSGHRIADGLRIVGVRPGGPADVARPFLRVDDVILTVNGRVATSPRDLKPGARGGPSLQVDDELLLTVSRGKSHLLIVLERQIGEVLKPRTAMSPRGLPVEIQAVVGRLATRLNVDNGVRVTRTFGPSPLLLGDVIVAVNGVTVGPNTSNDSFQRSLRGETNDTIQLDVVRGSVRLSILAVLESRPLSAEEMPVYDESRFEFRLRELTVPERADGDAGNSGVMVVSVKNGGWASIAQVAAGDVVLSIDGSPTRTMDDVRSALRAERPGQELGTLVLLRRGSKTLFVVLKSRDPRELPP